MRSVDNPEFWSKRTNDLGTAQVIYELRQQGYSDAAIMDFLIDVCHLQAGAITWPAKGWPRSKRTWKPISPERPQ